MNDYSRRDLSSISDRFYEEFKDNPHFVCSVPGSRSWFDRTFRRDVSGDEAILVGVNRILPWGTGIPRVYEGVRVRRRFTGQLNLQTIADD